MDERSCADGPRLGDRGARDQVREHQAALQKIANENDGNRFSGFSGYALDVNADSIAFALLTYAYSTESVNGVPGRRVSGNFQIPAPAGSEGTFVS